MPPQVPPYFPGDQPSPSWLHLQGLSVSQSSVVEGGVADRAIDGNLASAFSQQSCVQTGPTDPRTGGRAWWQLLLGEPTSVGKVRERRAGSETPAHVSLESPTWDANRE